MNVSLPRYGLAIGLAMALTTTSPGAAEPLLLPAVADEVKEAPAPPSVVNPPLKDVTPPELTTTLTPTLVEPVRAGGLYGSAEFLLLRPHLSSQDYAIVDPTNDITPAGPLRSVNDSQRFGFQVEIGYRFPTSGWDASFTYLTFHSRGTDSATAPAGGLLYPELTRPGLTDTALNALANARLNYNTYDIALGKTFDIDPWTQFRMFGGVRFASIQQTVAGYYNGLLADDAYASSQSNFSGAGPIVGAEMRWKVFRGLSLFGKAEGGLIYGNTQATLFETNNAGGTLYTNVTDNYGSMVPTVGFSIGASWQYRGFTVSAGYQAVNWFGLIQRPALVDSFSEGKIVPQNTDFSLDGFFFRLAYAY
jgi:hypothetical protein